MRGATLFSGWFSGIALSAFALSVGAQSTAPATPPQSGGLPSVATPAADPTADTATDPTTDAATDPTTDAATDPTTDVAADPAPDARATPGPSSPLVPRALPTNPLPDDDTCQDTWPPDRERPVLHETFPKKGIAGHVSYLKVELRHLPGEIVFPAGLSFRPDAPEVESLQSAHFYLPRSESDIKPSLQRTEGQKADPAPEGQTTVTTITLPVIPLPPEAGRRRLTLPRFPLAVARASGQVHTLCTDPHVIEVEDPLTSVAEPKKQSDPEPRVQMEVWTTLRDIVVNAAWALPLLVLLAWLLVKYGGRLKKTPPPPPPIPPWQVARQQLAELREQRFLEAGEYEKQLDGVCDILRRYLGARFGFDGLECTTAELLRALNARAPDFSEEQSVRTVLQRTDLVKFARRAPTAEECEDARILTERIIDKTKPSASLDPRTVQSKDQEAYRG